jgi:hypothetical protein
VVEEHGEESQNGRSLSWAETNHVVSVEKKHYTGSCLQFVERKSITSRQHCVSTGYRAAK